MKTKLIALSAISAALTAITLSAGAIFEFIDLFTVCIVPLFISMPLYFNSKKGAALASLVGGIIALMVNPFSLVWIFHFGFFGFYPILKFVFITQNKKQFWFKALSLIWFVIVSLGAYFFYIKVLGGVPDDIFGLPEWTILLIFALLAVVFYFVVDKFIYILQLKVFYILNKIIK